MNKIDIYTTIVYQNPFAFSNPAKVPRRYRNIKQVYSIAIQGYPNNIKYVSAKTLEKDRDICFYAVRKDRYAIQDMPAVSFIHELYQVIEGERL